MGAARRLIGAALVRSGLQHLPVRSRRGLLAGARWTLYPHSAYWRGTHEPAMQEVAAALGGGEPAGWTCWDLGAHFGFYSVGLARRVGPAGEICAFEPDPVSFARLARHARMNRMPWLKVFPVAASDRSGEAEIYTYGRPGSTVSHLPYAGEPRQESCHPLSVRTARLDEWVRSGRIRPPRFVKLDVEGHGVQALSGMIESVRASRPIMAVGFHTPEEAGGIIELLRPLGYRHRPVGSVPGPGSPGDHLFTPPE